MKRALPLLMALVMALSLTACGASSKAADSAENSMSYTTGSSSYSQSADMKLEFATDDMGWAEAPMEPSVEESAGEMDKADESGASPLENAKIIYTGELYLETKEFDKASAALDALVKELGGYYESRNLSQGGTYRSFHATVRVPADSFSPFLQRAGEVAHVTDCYEQNRNISEVYYDTESRLVTQRTKLERLQELLKQADTMEDIITLESAISETELAIEQLTGSLRKYDNLVDFSTITVNLNEVYRLSTDEVPEQTFGDRLRNAFVRGIERGIDNLEDFVIYIARNWITLLVWAAVIAGAIAFVRRKWRKRNLFLRKPDNTPEDKGE